MTLSCMQGNNGCIGQVLLYNFSKPSYTHQVLTPGPMASSMVLVQSGWVVSSVVVKRLDSSTVLPDHWVLTTVHTPEMLECCVHAAFRET